ncbi:MAG TPA: plastocyanin/azurin family copper-binding protein, partial [Candidatus Limnocylindrales bacterium]
VQAAGSAYPQTQAQLDATAASAAAADIATGHALEAAYKTSVTTNADGTKTYNFAAGLGKDNIEILRFITGQSNLRVGDSIVWTNYSSGEPHSVSFGTEPQGPGAEGPSGGSTYPASGFVSSGLFLGAPLPGSHTYKLTFTKAGTYKYFCVLHDIVGMVGSVNVTAAPVATLPPTSTAPVAASSGGSDTGLPWALVALGLAGAVLSLGRLVRRVPR